MRRVWLYFASLLKSVFAIGIMAGALLFIIVYPFSDGTLTDLTWAVLTLISVAAVTFVLRRLKLMIWMVVTYLFYVVAVVYAADMMFTPNVVGGYRTAVLTVAVITTHGFAGGAFVELVTVLHRVTSRGLDLLKEKTRLKLEEE